MALKKCPRCELNYILDEGTLCTVCREEVHGKKEIEEPQLICSVCGEAAALPGEDMCKACLAEFRTIEMTATGAEDEEAVLMEDTELEPEPVSSLDEMEAIEDLEDEAEDEPIDDEESTLMVGELAEA